MTLANNIRPEVENTILSPQELKDFFLFGIDLSNDDGTPFPEAMYEFYIRSAQNWLETQIPGLVLCEQEIVERKDYHLNDYVSFAFLKLNRYPINEVSEVAVQFPLSTNAIVFDPSWYRAESVGAQLNLVPTQGTFSSILLSQGGSFLPLFYSGQSYIPDLWRIKYKAGFKAGKVPPMLREIVGMQAAMGPLNVAGDLIAGAGIASKSIGIDGLSQSISTTSSATNAGYGARIITYEKEIKRLLKDAQRYFTGIQFVVA